MAAGYRNRTLATERNLRKGGERGVDIKKEKAVQAGKMLLRYV